MKRIVIIDNDLSYREEFKTLIEAHFPSVEIYGETNNIESGYQLIQQSQPQGVFIDINLEDGSGFDLLDKFKNPFFHLVIISQDRSHALKAFRYHALDFLQKPIDTNLLKESIRRIIENPMRIKKILQGQYREYNPENKIKLSSLDGLVFLRINQVSHIESKGSYTSFFLIDREHHLISKPMKDFEELLAENNFFHVHQSYIINLNYVKKVIRGDNACVLLENGFKVPVARRRKDPFLVALHQYYA